jgi:hypothetical protein
MTAVHVIRKLHLGQQPSQHNFIDVGGPGIHHDQESIGIILIQTGQLAEHRAIGNGEFVLERHR